MIDPPKVEDQTSWLREGLIISERLDKTAITRGRAVGYDDTVMSLLFPAHTPEANLCWHVLDLVTVQPADHVDVKGERLCPEGVS
jgi:hypothetical protein